MLASASGQSPRPVRRAGSIDAGQMATHSPVSGRTTRLTGRRSECDVLDRLIDAVRAGESRGLVMVGEPGLGKTALLDYVAARASGCRVAHAAGIQSEMELAFAALHQLCAPMLDVVERLPVPQREALRTAFGVSAGPPPDRFLVGLAVLSLLSDVAEEQPLVCLVDDEQWLDRASAQTLAFVARRLEAESVGMVLAARVPVDGRVEERFRRRADALPAETRRLLLVAAADPTGDPGLLWRAAGQLGIPVQAATPAAEAGLLELGAWVRFRHPLVRSAAYRSASRQERQDVHRALAEVTDPLADPDRRAWHRAQAAPGPDERVAAELERSAGRAQARGGMAAAAAFLERAAMLTPETGRRAQRLLAAARAKTNAGALDAALGLLIAVEAGPPDALRTADVEHLRGQIAFDQRRAEDAVGLLLSAARRLEPLNAGSARDSHLEALGAAMWVGDLGRPGGVRRAAEAARAAPPGPDPPRVVDVLLDGLALRLTEGYAAAAPALARTVELVLALDVANDDVDRRLWVAGGRAGITVALELWDAGSWHALAARQVQFARDTGALVQLQVALNLLSWTHLLAGELTMAAQLLEEDRLVAEATGNPPVAYNEMMLAAWRGQEAPASELIEATGREATAGGLGRFALLASYAGSVLHNGLGRHDAARDAALRAFVSDQVGFGPFVVPELAEAASRTGDVASLRAALEWLSERTRVTPTEWVLGIEARVRALLSEGEAADSLYRESIDRLSRTRVRAELARAHLLYGEWLRRQRRRADAREQLRTAHDMLDTMGMKAFAERARRELLATGETARKRTIESSGQLTAQEAQVARLARDGLSNPEIGARLFISARTVQYHLSKVFAKLGISSRSQLDRILPGDPDTGEQR